MNLIRVIIFEDNLDFVDSMSELIHNAEGIDLVGVFHNCKNVVKNVQHLQPDVVLMDIDMPVMNGIETLKEIKKQYPDVKVIILSMHNEAGMIKSLIDLGANGYLLKSCSQDEVVSAIRKVAAGQSCFSTDVTMALLKPANPEQKTEILTERETEILKLIAAGFSNKEVGDKLFISHRTVDTHRTNLMKKLSVNNIAGLISYAIKNGIV